MPLNRGKSRGHRLTGLTTAKVGYEDIDVDDMDTDLSSVAGTDSTLASAKAIKTYVDAQTTIAGATDTSITLSLIHI